MRIVRLIRRYRLMPVGVVAIPAATLVIATSPIRVAVVTISVIAMLALAVLGAVAFDVRRLLLSQQNTLTEHRSELTDSATQQQQRLDQIRDDLARKRSPRRMNPEELIRKANTYTSDGHARLAVINELYLSAQFTPLALADPEQPLSLDNLRTAVTPASQSGPTVSVIMPVRNAEGTIGYALRSVLDQTWADIEVIVVDDASTDDTVTIAEKISADDPRVTIVRQPVNRGTYAARNLGLSYAAGELVTTHDADDWSHAQMLEAQIQPLLSDVDLPATMSYCVRCHDDLTLTLQPWNTAYLKLCYVSLMVRREVFDDIGTWDAEARVGADGEFMYRVAARYGTGAIREVAKSVPLSLALQRDDSLTVQSSPTALASNNHALGARSLYREAYTEWHAGDRFHADLPWTPGDGNRPFPLPPAMKR